MMITVSFISPGVFPWSALDSGNGLIASGTGTTVANAGSLALTAMKNFLQNQATSFQAQGTNWQ
jgi:hypothetical protein